MNNFEITACMPRSWKNKVTSRGITIVSDPGLDDLLALALLDKLTRGVPKQLVSTFGNMSAAVTSANARDFVSIAGSDWSYRAGPELPIAGSITEGWIDAKQGANGLWGIRPRKGSDVRELACDSGCRQVISLATLGEVKELMQTDTIDDLLIMGGLFDRYEENGNPAELNIRFDAEAAKWVFENCQRVDVTLVPAEVEFDTGWTKQQVESIPETNPMNSWLKQLLLAGYENGRYMGSNELYDPVTILLAFEPSYATWRQSGVAVNDAGSRRGRTVLNATNPAVSIAVKPTDPQIVSDKLFELLFL